jgi:hypothetical protein
MRAGSAYASPSPLPPDWERRSKGLDWRYVDSSVGDHVCGLVLVCEEKGGRGEEEARVFVRVRAGGGGGDKAVWVEGEGEKEWVVFLRSRVYGAPWLVGEVLADDGGMGNGAGTSLLSASQTLPFLPPAPATRLVKGT